MYFQKIQHLAGHVFPKDPTFVGHVFPKDPASTGHVFSKVPAFAGHVFSKSKIATKCLIKIYIEWSFHKEFMKTLPIC